MQQRPLWHRGADEVLLQDVLGERGVRMVRMG